MQMNFDIGVDSKNQWIFLKATWMGSRANVDNVAGSITQYRNSQFYWNKSGQVVDWNGFHDREQIFWLLWYG